MRPGVLPTEPVVSGTAALKAQAQPSSLQPPGAQVPPFPLLMVL